MKRRLFGAVCLAVALCMVFGMTAEAADETQMTVTYIKQEPARSTDSGDDAPSRPAYVIAIPAEFSLNTSDTMPLYLTENNIPEGKRLHVHIDGARTIAEDGYMHLQGTQGDDARVRVGIYNSAGREDALTFQGAFEVAAFERGDVHPVWGGTMFLHVVNDDELTPDTYTGTLYFSLNLSDT